MTAPTEAGAGVGPLRAKAAMLMKWSDEQNPHAISRKDAADMIRKNRRRTDGVKVTVTRKHRETYIASRVLGVECVIYAAAIAKATGATP